MKSVFLTPACYRQGLLQAAKEHLFMEYSRVFLVVTNIDVWHVTVSGFKNIFFLWGSTSRYFSSFWGSALLIGFVL